MKKTLLKNLIVLIVVGVTLGGCKKEAGPVGPEGPKGEAGAKGEQGAPGTANVIYSDWIPLPAKAVFSSPMRKNFSIQAPEVTLDVIKKGVFYAYLRHGSSEESIVPLPYAGSWVNTTTNEVIGSYLSTVLVGVGSISLNQDWLTPGAIPATFANATAVSGGYTHIRYVIVPAGLKSSSTARVDFKNYESVKKVYFDK